MFLVRRWPTIAGVVAAFLIGAGVVFALTFTFTIPATANILVDNPDLAVTLSSGTPFTSKDFGDINRGLSSISGWLYLKNTGNIPLTLQLTSVAHDLPAGTGTLDVPRGGTCTSPTASFTLNPDQVSNTGQCQFRFLLTIDANAPTGPLAFNITIQVDEVGGA